MPHNGVILGVEKLVDRVYLVSNYHLGLGDYGVGVAEVNTLLCLRDPTNDGPSDDQLPVDQGDATDCVGLQGCTEQHQLALVSL